MTLSVTADDEVMDFSSPRKSLKFRVDGDLFEAAPDIAAELMIEFGELADQVSDESSTIEQQKELLRAMFRMVLLPDSADRFIARLRSTENPIGHDKINRITRWLFEAYGLRPTEPDSASSPGSANPDAGRSLTASTSDAA